MRIDHYVMRSQALDGVDVFKIPQIVKTDIFVSVRFAGDVAEAGLTGAVFEPVSVEL